MKSLYTDGLTLEVKVDINDNTFWLTQKEMARLFDISIDNIGSHIKNILKDNELDKSTTEESSEVRIEGNRKIRRKVLICLVIFPCNYLRHYCLELIVLFLII